MALQRLSPQVTRDHQDLAMVREWEANDYIDLMAAVLLGVALTALALSIL